MSDKKTEETLSVWIDDFEFHMSKELAEYTEKYILVKNPKYFPTYKSYDLLDLFEDKAKE